MVRTYVAVLCLACFEPSFIQAQNPVNVLTRNYNNQRTGVNRAETVLNTSNVNANGFGRLFQIPVDDQLYAGLLYVNAVALPDGSSHNVLFAATVNNSVYAFDADRGGSPLWQRNFNGSGRPTLHTEVGQACGSSYSNFTGNIGIVSTPVIDKAAGTIYLVTRTVETGTTVQRLHALDIATGNERPNSPVVIQASVPGKASGGSTVTFDPLTANQRPALALSAGAVYLSWASYCDTYKYFGWVMAYDSSTLSQTGVFNVSPDGGAGGIWMGGGAPAFDRDGNVFLTAGNGIFDGITNYGESVVKLAPRTLQLLDYYTPSTYLSLSAADLDLGPSGPTMIPGGTLFVQGDKSGLIHVLDSSNLGHVLSDAQTPQTFQAVDTAARPTATHHVHNSTVLWNSPQGLNLYVWGENDYPRLYRFNGSTFNFPATAVGAILPPFGMPGGMMTVSSDAAAAGTGILWASAPFSGDAQNSTVPGMLYAFNAENLDLIWSSSADADNMGNFAKYNPPVVANGKVYIASFSNVISVYGVKNYSYVAINSGGNTLGRFGGDRYFTGGSLGVTTNLIDTSKVTNPAPQAAYQDERFGNFSYSIPNLVPGGVYAIRMHFSEFFWTAAGQRVFNVTVNSRPVLTNFDIFAAAGGSNIAIAVPTLAEADANGQITLTFTGVIDNAKVDAIEFIRRNTAP